MESVRNFELECRAENVDNYAGQQLSHIRKKPGFCCLCRYSCCMTSRLVGGGGGGGGVRGLPPPEKLRPLYSRIYM